jgi:hypothetical protein
MDIDIGVISNPHLLGKDATHLPVPRLARHAALHGTPITALASVFNCRF